MTTAVAWIGMETNDGRSVPGVVIAGIAVAAGAESELGPLAAAYVLILAVCGPLSARAADRIAAPQVPIR